MRMRRIKIDYKFDDLRNASYLDDRVYGYNRFYLFYFCFSWCEENEDLGFKHIHLDVQGGCMNLELRRDVEAGRRIFGVVSILGGI